MNQEPTKNISTSPSLCAYAWSHVRLMLKSSYLPCCNYVGEPISFKQNETLNDVMHGSYLSDMREKMLQGEKIPGCHRCYNREASSGHSMRTNLNREFAGIWNEAPKVRSVEYNFGNLCNLKCRGCNSSVSTKWAQDEIKLGWPPENVSQPYRNSLSTLDDAWETLTHVKLIGGEPLLFREHEEFIKVLNEKNSLERITLEYATNGTIKVSQFVLECWNRLKCLELAFSFDGLKERNDFFREGCRWQDVVENIHWYRKNLNPEIVKLRFHTVVNIYNVHEIVDLDDWLMLQFPEFDMSKDFMYSPSWMDIRNLPQSTKLELMEKYKNCAESPNYSPKRRRIYQAICDYLGFAPTSDFADFIREDLKLNTLRGYKLEETHPHLARIVESYKLEEE